jgi:hypothetical protein
MSAIVVLAGSLLLAAAAGPPQSIEAFGHRWRVPIAADWAVEGSGKDQVLRMLVARPSTAPRRPTQFALADAPPFEEVTIEAEVKRDGGSLILVYAWRDENHFNYAHLSVDAPASQPVHNGIFHVYGGDRVRISNENGPGALPSTDWTPVKLVYSARSGEVRVEVGGKQFPSLRGIDLSLGAGRVGIGSFFETAQFRNVRIRGSEGTTSIR